MVDQWDLMTDWHLVLPPSRPSATQLVRIRSQIDSFPKNKPIAILGSTPEFRDLVHECGFSQIYVLDKNATFYRSMCTARVYRNAEQFVEGDWFNTLGTFRGKFSVILSDLTSGNISYESRKTFYDLITDALCEGGLFLDKVLTHSSPHLSLEEIIRKYSQLPLNLLHINYFSCEALFCSELLDRRLLVDSSFSYSMLDEVVKNERVRRFVQKSKLITPPGCVWWYGRRWEELSADYCSRLSLLEAQEDDPGSPYLGRLKFFAHRKDTQ